jgi:hypothetical protein
MIYYVKANSYLLSRALIFLPIKHCFTECEHIEVDDEQQEWLIEKLFKDMGIWCLVKIKQY